MQLAQRTAERYREKSELARAGLPRPPLSSLGHGAAGVAYFLLRHARLAGDQPELDAAAGWIALAERDLNADGAFVAGVQSAVFPRPRRPPPPSSSVYLGEAGVWCVAALVASARGDTVEVERAVGRFVGIADACPGDDLDTMTGVVGLLLAAAVLVEELGEQQANRLHAAGDRLAERVTAAVADRGRAEPLEFLGAAHGWCGVAHALLRWVQATSTDPSPVLRGLLDELRDARLPSGLWPRRKGSNEVWPGWCHGSAGWAQLWTLAWEVLGEGEFLQLAERVADDAVGAGDLGGGGLCCGLAGQAYAALAVFRAAGDETWLRRAQRLAADAAGTPLGEGFPEHSLWRGDLGVALLATELEDPRRAAMPLYRALA